MDVPSASSERQGVVLEPVPSEMRIGSHRHSSQSFQMRKANLGLAHGMRATENPGNLVHSSLLFMDDRGCPIGWQVRRIKRTIKAIYVVQSSLQCCGLSMCPMASLNIYPLRAKSPKGSVAVPRRFCRPIAIPRLYVRLREDFRVFPIASFARSNFNDLMPPRTFF